MSVEINVVSAVLAFALVSFQASIPSIIRFLTSLSMSRSDKEREITKTIKQLKLEQSGISMMDNFAKFAKIDRQIIKLRSELVKIAEARSSERSHAEGAFKLTFYALAGLMGLFTVYQFGSEPVIRFLDRDPFYPLGGVIGFPSKYKTVYAAAIGLPVWSGLCRVFLRIVMN